MDLIIPDARSASIHVQGRSEIFRVLADAGAKSLLRPGWEGGAATVTAWGSVQTI